MLLEQTIPIKTLAIINSREFRSRASSCTHFLAFKRIGKHFERHEDSLHDGHLNEVESHRLSQNRAVEAQPLCGYDDGPTGLLAYGEPVGLRAGLKKVGYRCNRHHGTSHHGTSPHAALYVCTHVERSGTSSLDVYAITI